jgi:hypothetical protein
MPEYLGELSVLEADLKVQLVPFQKEYVQKNADYYEVWRPINVSDPDILKACSDIYRSDAGEIYGFLQIPWFAIRQILRRVGINMNGRNWFPSGEICSETLWSYLSRLPMEYSCLVSGVGENECSPEDLYAVVQSRSDLFKKILVKD